MLFSEDVKMLTRCGGRWKHSGPPIEGSRAPAPKMLPTIFRQQDSGFQMKREMGTMEAK